MKIYRSSTYVEDGQYYQLEVINMWDLKSKATCSKKGITYKLNYTTRISDDMSTSKEIKSLSSEMIKEIKEMGYKIISE